MTDFGKKAADLLKDIVSRDNQSLSQYNEEQVRLVLAEVQQHHQETEKVVRRVQEQQYVDHGTEDHCDWGAYPQYAVALVIHAEAIKRNKRLLLTYMNERIERLKAVRWKRRYLPDSVAECCSPEEREFFKRYDAILNEYISDGENGIGLDLTLDLAPPKDPNVTVRVLKDAGEHIFSFGRANLVAGTLHFLPADEAEPLVREGVLREVSWGSMC